MVLCQEKLNDVTIATARPQIEISANRIDERFFFAAQLSLVSSGPSAATREGCIEPHVGITTLGDNKFHGSDPQVHDAAHPGQFGQRHLLKKTRFEYLCQLPSNRTRAHIQFAWKHSQ